MEKKNRLTVNSFEFANIKLSVKICLWISTFTSRTFQHDRSWFKKVDLVDFKNMKPQPASYQYYISMVVGTGSNILDPLHIRRELFDYPTWWFSVQFRCVRMLFSVFHYLLEKYNFINLKSITNKASSEKVKKKEKKKESSCFGLRTAQPSIALALLACSSLYKRHEPWSSSNASPPSQM